MQALFHRQDQNGYLKGDLHEIRASGAPFTATEAQGYVLVEVPDVPMAAYEQYKNTWELELDLSVVAQDAAQDGFRIRLSAANNNAALGALSRSDVEQFINRWNGTVFSAAANEVVFDIRIYDALTSGGFWDTRAVDQGAIQFTEVSYDQGTGIHRIQADMSALSNNPTYLERYVARRAAQFSTLGDFDIVSHANKVLVYDADRTVVRGVFEYDLAEKAKRVVARRRYHVSEAVVDNVISQGGTVTTSAATFMSYLQDKVSE